MPARPHRLLSSRFPIIQEQEARRRHGGHETGDGCGADFLLTRPAPGPSSSGGPSCSPVGLAPALPHRVKRGTYCPAGGAWALLH